MKLILTTQHTYSHICVMYKLVVWTNLLMKKNVHNYRKEKQMVSTTCINIRYFSSLVFFSCQNLFSHFKAGGRVFKVFGRFTWKKQTTLQKQTLGIAGLLLVGYFIGEAWQECAEHGNTGSNKNTGQLKSIQSKSSILLVDNIGTTKN